MYARPIRENAKMALKQHRANMLQMLNWGMDDLQFVSHLFIITTDFVYSLSTLQAK